jgi:hypothetical protein
MKSGQGIIKVELPYVEFPEQPRVPTPNVGVWSFITTDSDLVALVADEFGRESGGLCLKIFKQPVSTDHPGNHTWSPYPVNENCTVEQATIAQNIAWLHGLAPRVFGLFTFEQDDNTYLGQLTVYMGDHDFGGLSKKQDTEQADEFMRKLIKLEDDGYIKVSSTDSRSKNIVNGYWVDFQDFHLPETLTTVKSEANKVLNWHPPGIYQGVEEWGMKGRRSMDHRIKALGLDKIDFKGKTVLDIGCSNGAFLRYARDRAARS